MPLLLYNKVFLVKKQCLVVCVNMSKCLIYAFNILYMYVSDKNTAHTHLSFLPLRLYFFLISLFLPLSLHPSCLQLFSCQHHVWKVSPWVSLGLVNLSVAAWLKGRLLAQEGQGRRCSHGAFFLTVDLWLLFQARPLKRVD